MAQVRTDDLKTRYVVWLAPEWLVRFRAEALLFNEYNEPNKALTVADCAALITVLGRFTNDIVNPNDDHDLNMSVEIREKRTPREMPTIIVPWQELRDELGLVTRRDVYRILERIRYAVVNKRPLFDLFAGFEGRPEFKPEFPMRYAHPLNSGVRQAAPVDVRAWSKFSCIHSIPIAARLTVWLSTRCRVGLNRESKYSSTHLDHVVAAHRVPSDLGVTMRTWLPNLLPLDRIAQDLATIGIHAEFRWSYVGRKPDRLHIRAWRKGIYLTAQPAVPDVSRKKEWLKKKFDYVSQNGGRS